MTSPLAFHGTKDVKCSFCTRVLNIWIWRKDISTGVYQCNHIFNENMNMSGLKIVILDYFNIERFSVNNFVINEFHYF